MKKKTYNNIELLQRNMKPSTKRLTKKKATLGMALVASTLGSLVAIPLFVVIAVANLGIQVSENVWKAIPASVPVDIPLPQYSQILDKNGVPFASFYSENRVPIKTGDIPQQLKNAFVAVEDRNFYTHKGWDPYGTLRATIATLTGGAVQGGSGITQQYVKNLLVLNATTEEDKEKAQSKNVVRKIKELKTSTELEKIKTKDEIIGGYLNSVYFGNRTYGVGAASQFYFNKNVTQLTVAEMATLAAMVNNANLYDPITNPDVVKERRDVVIRKMFEEGMITEKEKEENISTPLQLNITYANNGCFASPYPFYCAWVRSILETSPEFGATQEERDKLLYRGGLTVHTALDPELMQKAQIAVNTAVSETQNEVAALATVQPGTGLVPAIALSKKFGQEPNQTEIIVPVVPAFQQGSTFKPFTVATAIESGFNPDMRFTVGASYIPEGRNYPEGGFKNSEDGPGGDYNMTSALARSSNTWLVALEDKVGVVNTAKLASKMGITSLPLEGANAITEKDASLTLGTFATSPLEVANAFATLAAGGESCKPIAITKVTTQTSEEILPPQPKCEQVMKPSTAHTVTRMLTEVVDGSDPYRTGIRASIGRPVAGKTGTSDSHSSAWFAGYTPQYATAVMIADPRGGFQYPLTNLYAYSTWWGPAYGGGAPALIWKDYMSKVHENIPPTPFPIPNGESWVGTQYVSVPNVVGLTEQTAKAVLFAEGYTNVTVAPATNPTTVGLPKGVVVQMTPPPGEVTSVTPNKKQQIVLTVTS